MEQNRAAAAKHGDAPMPTWCRQAVLGHSPENLADLLFRLATDDGGDLFAIVDAAALKDALAVLAGSQLAYEPLFTSQKMAAFMAVGPFLVRFEKEDGLPPWFTGDTWGTSSVVFFTSPAPISDLVGHLKGCLGAVTPDDRELVFRYYDPRILRCYLPSCKAAEAWRLMGPICRFMVASEDGASLRSFDRAGLGKPPAQDDPVWEQPLFVRTAQMALLRKDVARRFCRKMRIHLSDRFARQIAQKDLDEAALGALVANGLERARMYGILRDFDVQRYLEYMLVLDPDFDIDPQFDWASAILYDQDLSGTQKMDRMDRMDTLRLLGAAAADMKIA